MRRSRWSWAGLAAWLANACLAVTVAAGLVFGADVADQAWARGIHVTPAQAALHSALMAEGFSHHHGGPHLASPIAMGEELRGASLLPMAGGSTWGAPPVQALDVDAPELGAQGCCRLLAPDEATPAGVEPAPRTPPPEAA